MLQCEECGTERRSDQAQRWRGYLTLVEEGQTRPEVVVYCPDCAKREFGDDDDLNGKIPTIVLDGPAY